jgi:hypothetical protein
VRRVRQAEAELQAVRDELGSHGHL